MTQAALGPPVLSHDHIPRLVTTCKMRQHPRLAPCLLAFLFAWCLAACSVSSAPTDATVSPPAAPSDVTVSPTSAPMDLTAGPVLETFQFAGQAIPDPPERDLFRLASELIPGIPGDFPKAAAPGTGNLEVGRVDTFWLADLELPGVYQSSFKLALVSDHAYWYVEAGEKVGREDLKRSATVFDEQVYPRVTSVFGSEWSPGVDGDTRVTVLNGAIRGAGGYFNSTDEYPSAIFEYSNQREMIYVNIASIPIGSSAYPATLAHELQHLIHWHQDPSEDTWVNEGLSELATSVAGFGTSSIQAYLDGIPTSLVNWTLDSVGIGASYGAAGLFMHYLAEHYGSRDDMRLLLETQSDGVNGINEYLRKSGYDQTFQDVFRDWTVANYLDLPEGVYGYPGLHVRARTNKFIDDYTGFNSRIPQYSVEYVALESFEGPIRIQFKGDTAAKIIPADAGPEGCWWSNAGDAIASTLTRDLDLNAKDRASLSYDLWYDLEKDWDYAYVQVSADGGRRWEILAASGTSSENPVGNSFGDGYTGNSGGWTTESVDLSPYAGKHVRVRFQYLTDDAVHGPGLCIRDIGVVEDGLLRPVEDWQPEGFVLTNNEVPQSYIVQVISGQVADGKEVPRVTEMELDEANSGILEIRNPEEMGRLVVVVAALAPKTFQPGSYSLTVAPAN